MALVIKPNSTEEYALEVAPYGYGKYDFRFDVSSGLMTPDSFEVRLTVNPTMKGKYFASVTGLPITVLSINHLYLIDAILSFIS